MTLNIYGKFETLPANSIVVTGWSDEDEKYTYVYDLDKYILYEGKCPPNLSILGDNFKKIKFTEIYNSSNAKIRKLSYTSNKFNNYDAILIIDKDYSFMMEVRKNILRGHTVHFNHWVHKTTVINLPINCIADIAKIIKPMYEQIINADTNIIKNTFSHILSSNNTKK